MNKCEILLNLIATMNIIKYLIVLEMTAKMKASRNLTLMVWWIAILYLSGTVPFSIINILRVFLDPSTFLVYAFDLTVVSVFSSHGMNIFIYFHFNSMFKAILTGYFKKIKTLVRI